MKRRPATPEEAKALANPLRLRILRLCLLKPMTNKELADRLGKDPGAVLHHVRTLHRAGFLEVGEVRTGARGALEKPYQATGKSWAIDIGEEQESSSAVASLDAFRAEMYESGPDAIEMSTRFVMHLRREVAEKFQEQLAELVRQYMQEEDPEGQPYGVFLGMHRTQD